MAQQNVPAAQLTTVAPVSLTSLSKLSVMHPNYDRTKLVNHAIRLFLLSYPEFDQTMFNDEFYRPKLNEFVTVIQELYEQPIANLETTVNEIWFSAKAHDMVILFTAKKVRHRGNVGRMGLTWENIDANKRGAPLLIELNRDVQIGKTSQIACSFDELRHWKKNNHKLRIRPMGIQWHQSVANQPLNNFEIGFNEIHAEGYEELFDFGRGFEILIEIVVKVLPNAQDLKTVDAKDFHLETIFRMLCKRIDNCNRAEVKWTRHMTQNQITFLRPRVQPNSQNIFWRRSAEDSKTSVEAINKMGDLKTKSEAGQQMPVKDVAYKKVLYFDLQRVCPHGEDDEERVCLCNEFCNLSAFFDRNPIYRFIIVQNSQLFLAFIGNVPDIYVFCAIAVLARNTQNANNGLVFPLVRSAEEYRYKYFNKYFVKQVLTFRDQYNNNSHPDQNTLCGAAYNLLRRHVPIVRAIRELSESGSLTDEVCIANIIGYDTVLWRLHMRVKRYAVFVPTAIEVRWKTEIESVRHIQRTVYLKETYEQLLQRPQPVIDRLLGTDYEYQSFVPLNKEQLDIKSMRTSIVHKENKVNVKVSLTNFANTYIWIYKFVTQIESRLSTPRYEGGWQSVHTYCAQMDADFRARYDALPQNDKNNLFQVTEQEVTSSGVPENFREHIYALFTLKLYSFGFVIQRHCIRARDRTLQHMMRRLHLPNQQIVDSFSFITDQTVIEETFKAHFSKKYRLNVSVVKTDALFDFFYGGFWKKADHEANPNPNDYMFNIESALKQYRKLYVWSKERGDDKKRMTAIVQNFDKELEQKCRRCVELLTTYVTPVCAWLYNSSNTEGQKYLLAPELMDVMVLYMIRATGYNVMAILFKFFTNIYNKVDNKALSQQFLAFNLSKPGWIPLMNSMAVVIEKLDQLITPYIIYDDEMERIAKTVDTTKVLAKGIYRHHYYKLSYEWMEELSRVNDQTLNKQLTADNEKSIGHLMELQLMFGLAFTSKYHQQFRITFFQLRVLLKRCFDRANRQTVFLQRFVSARTHADNYLSDDRAIAEANPTNYQNWTQLLTQTNPDILKLNATDVNLDMSSADQQM